MIGITGYGAYLPRTRLSRQVMADANAWFDPSLRGLAKGERSACHWDEDAITMAVEAGRDCLSCLDFPAAAALWLASTTLPFSDRQNSVVVGEALNLGQRLPAMDVGGSQRAATSALRAMLAGATDAADAADAPDHALLIASEHRRARSGSRQEMVWGDGAAALAIGGENVVAEYLGAASVAEDFVDHYHGGDAEFGQEWEQRWVRDEGYLHSVPSAVGALLEQTATAAADIAHFVLASEQPRVPGGVAKTLGIAETAVADNLIEACGVTGAAHPILLLARALERAEAGDLILVAGFGQGCDALLFRATNALAARGPSTGVSGTLARRRPDDNYNRFLSFNHLIEREIGKRGEADRQAFLSALNRRRDLLNGFIGGQCRQCGTLQIPAERYCVNPDCGALDSQDDYPFSRLAGAVRTWTADRLTFDWSPPAYFGMIEFEGGARLMMDFTEVDADTLDTGTPVSVHFRIRSIDRQRGFRQYFWKAIPG